MRIKNLLLAAGFISIALNGFSQTAPNVAGNTPLPGNTAAASKFSAASVNLYTGQIGVSIPIYSYSNNNDLKLAVQLNYTGSGGIKLVESPSSVGLGWFLNAGGIITRTVQGVPDDLPQKGFLYLTAIPNDFRANGDKYYYDTLDTQQDIFQFNIPGHSGKFYIRRNRDIIQVPLSPLKIIPEISSDPNDGQIKSFTIIAEDGVKYVFKNYETNTLSIANSKTGYSDPYNTAWDLTYIISPFQQDTIRYTYSSLYNTENFSYPVVYYLPYPYSSMSGSYETSGSNRTYLNTLQSISFPNGLRVDFIRSKTYLYAGGDGRPIEKILLSDSIFRKGFYFEYYNVTKILLKSITPYTASEKHKGYEFYYNTPYLDGVVSRGIDDVGSNVDMWGYNLGQTATGKPLPGHVWTQRNASVLSPVQGSVLNRIVLPEGGSEVYQYELNDKHPCTTTPISFTVPANSTTSNNVSLYNIFTNNHVLTLKIDTSSIRTGNPPLTGTCNFMCKIKSAVSPYQGLDSVTISLYDLYYTGVKFWTTAVADGDYIMETKLKGSGSVAIPFNIYVSWRNKNQPVNGGNLTGGGIRIKKIIHAMSATDTIGVSAEEFKYITEDGQSSGEIAEPAISSYYYKDIYLNDITGVEKNRLTYTFINQEPASVTDFSQGSHIGYSRVEVIKGTSTKNIGKEVHEFTTLKESDGELNAADFPYSPSSNYNAWALGLPKAVYVYDSSGSLLRKTAMTYDIKNILYNSADDKTA